jgi:SPP1 gp7 family putative phage head morphogenesis protein
MAGGISGSFALKPKEALKFFGAKSLKTSFAWQDVWQQEHEAAFTVAKIADVDLLADVRAAVEKAIADGQTLQQFSKALKPRLMEAGWWGKAEMVDPLTGESKLVQLGSARRLRTIFQTNMQTAYAAGDWAQIQENKAEAPYLMYDAIIDSKTRPQHRAWDGTVLPADDPWWDTHTPPNGFNCRCSKIQLSKAQAIAMGKAVADKAPPSPTREYTNPRTGEISRVPVGVDPGFAYNPGKDRLEHLRKMYDDRLTGFRNDN